MRNFGWFAIVGAVISSSTLGAAVASCSGSSSDDSSASAADASFDVNVDDVAVADSGTPNTCAPQLPANYAHSWVPPRNMPSACTPAQVQMYWDTCLGTASSSAQCSAFFSANAGCIACIDSQSTSSTYGALIDLPNSTSVANVAGCIALTDGDLSATGCGARYQANQFCKIDACETNCPVDSTAASFTAFSDCEADAGSTACKVELANSGCGSGSQYARCFFDTYENTIVGIGNIMCGSASDGGLADGGDGG
jgi:hypothetical protein